MSQTVTRRNEADRIKELLQRVSNLERRIRALVEGQDASEDEVLFNLTTLVVGVSPPYQVRRAGTLYEAVLGLAVAGSTTTTVTIYVNGVSAGTASITASQVNATTSLSVSVSVDDDVTVAVTTIGTAAEGLVVQLRIR